MLCQGRLAKLREELIEAIQWDRLWRCDLDAQRFACRGVIDDQQAIGSRHGPRAFFAGCVREVQVRRECPALPIGHLQRAFRHGDTS